MIYVFVDDDIKMWIKIHLKYWKYQKNLIFQLITLFNINMLIWETQLYKIPHVKTFNKLAESKMRPHCGQNLHAITKCENYQKVKEQNKN